MAFPLLQTKLFIPSTRNLLTRRQLIQLLEQGLQAGHRLFLVSSSAGSGKTSLLGEWAARHPHELCWCSLDGEDNEPARFWKYAIAALQRLHPEIGQNAAALLDSAQPVPPQTLLVSLLNDLAHLPQPVILVLDDYHLIANLEIDRSLCQPEREQ